MNKYREVLERSLDLASSGKPDEALSQLRAVMEEAAREQEHRWLVQLSRSAGVLYEQKGELENAALCYETSLAHDQSNPYTYLSLGELYERLGDRSSAEKYFAACRALAAETNDQELTALLKGRGEGK